MSSEIKGKRVRMVGMHHAMNPGLKAHLQDDGTVVAGPDGNGYWLVDFDTRTRETRWWVHPRHLECPHIADEMDKDGLPPHGNGDDERPTGEPEYV